MGQIDWNVVTTFEGLLASQEKYRQGVAKGQLIPLWWANNTQPYFAYSFAFEASPGTGVIMTPEEMEELFIVEQRVFNARLN